MIVGGSPPINWGAKGHATINLEAARSLPEDMPKFFRDAGPSLESLASQPDRWKFRSLSTLGPVNGPDHYINAELLGGRELPRDRYTYLGTIIGEQLNEKGTRPSSVGFLPYRITEVFEKLEAEMALLRVETDKGGASSVMAQQLQQNVVYTAGILGHYVADASQPLHTTVHADGWNEEVEANPEKFSTERGIHSRFESKLVNTVIKPGDISDRMKPGSEIEGDVFEGVQDFIKNSHRYVKQIYRLDAAGDLNPNQPSAEASELVKNRLTAGAQMLRNLWYTAWVRSEKLAATTGDELDEVPNRAPDRAPALLLLGTS